ncbi:MAG: efflux RND transporter periplasmic adaptor subunit [Candidatus Obscuribacterales bacterium]|nr:efflux RND transporter periplasmic adaptor subunit [Candidatus Obscuribacterales bacterium]
MTVNTRLRALATKKNLFISLTFIASIGVGYSLWHWLSEPKTEKVDAKTDSIAVVPVISKILFREDQLPGEINAYQDVIVYPKIPGFIKWLGVDRGSVVKKDQLMATMYAPEYLAKRNEALARIAAAKASVAAEESSLQDIQAELKKSQADLLADQSTYQRVNAASSAPGVIADNDVVQWSQTVEIDKQEVNALTKRVNAKAHEVAMRKEELQAKAKAYTSFADFASYLEIRAPFDGYITERKLHTGSFVGPDGSGAYPPICRIKQLNLLRIVAPVPEVDTPGVVPGSQVKFSVSTFPGQMFTGTVARIGNSLDKDTRTMPVELNYFNPDYKILPGMFCKVYWPTRRHESSLFVPTTAVVSTPLETFVCRVKGDIIEWTSVSTGQVMDGMVQVFGDLNEGDLVARQASEELENQSRVKTRVITK